MFIGHFAVGFGAKKLAPRVSLGTLFLASQFIDLLWPTLLLLGVERVRIVPGATAVTPLLFEHYPVSHSLVAVLGWAVFLGCAYFMLRRDSVGARVLAALVLSHWGLDALVHRPDLPLYPGSASLIGLSVWSSLPLTLALELGLFAVCLWSYVGSTAALDRSGRWGLWSLIIFLMSIYGANLLGPPPPSESAVAWSGQAQWLLVLWGYWIDAHRRHKNSGLDDAT